MKKIYKCGMERKKEDDNTFVQSCKHRFLGDCFKRLSCQFKSKNCT